MYNKSNRHINKKGNAASRANTQPLSEYFSVRTRIIFILCFVCMLRYNIVSVALSIYTGHKMQCPPPCKLFRTKHTTLLEGETFLKNKHKMAFFFNKMHIFGRKEDTISYCSIYNEMKTDT